jgi:hypothetical protein
VVALRIPRALGVTLLVLALVAGVIGVGAAQTKGGQWPDVRSAMQATAEQWRPGDVVVGLENLAYQDAMTYYDRELPARAPASQGFFTAHDALASAEARRALASGHRVWVVSSPPTDPTALANAAAEQFAAVRGERQFGGSYPVQVNEVRGR